VCIRRFAQTAWLLTRDRLVPSTDIYTTSDSLSRREQNNSDDSCGRSVDKLRNGMGCARHKHRSGNGPSAGSATHIVPEQAGQLERRTDDRHLCSRVRDSARIGARCSNAFSNGSRGRRVDAPDLPSGSPDANGLVDGAADSRRLG
jgi:hypothetical protein